MNEWRGWVGKGIHCGDCVNRYMIVGEVEGGRVDKEQERGLSSFKHSVWQSESCHWALEHDWKRHLSPRLVGPLNTNKILWQLVTLDGIEFLHRSFLWTSLFNMKTNSMFDRIFSTIFTCTLWKDIEFYEAYDGEENSYKVTEVERLKLSFNTRLKSHCVNK